MRHGSSHFNVQHYLPVGAAGLRRSVLAAIHADGDNARHGKPEGLEVGGQIGLPVPPAELEDSDGLPGSAGVGGELVRLGYLRRGVAAGRGCRLGVGMGGNESAAVPGDGYPTPAQPPLLPSAMQVNESRPRAPGTLSR